MTAAQKRMAGGAVASLVLGILGMFLIGPLGSIPAVICGHVAKSRIRQNPGGLDGDGLALAGLILGYVQIGLMVVMLPLLTAIALPSFARAREHAREAMCMNNLRQIDVAKEMWALENNRDEGTVLGPAEEAELPRYLGGSLPTCPSEGRYTLHPVGRGPECSVHGALPDTHFR